MSKLLVGILLLFPLVTSVSSAVAETSDDRWVLLGTIDSTGRTMSDGIDLRDRQGRSKAIRLVAAAGGMTISRVVVTYSNGQVHFEDRPPQQRFRLDLQDRTKPIDPRDEERFVDAVEVTYAPDNLPSPKSKLEVWALQSPMGAASKRGESAAAGDTEKDERLIATRALPLSVDRDAISLDGVQGSVGAIRIRSVDRAIYIVSVEIVDFAGTTSVPDFSGAIGVGTSSPWIAVAAGGLKQVRLAYRPDPASGGAATVEIYAAGGSQRKRGPAETDADAPRPYVEVPVFFGTDRKREADRQKNGRTLAVFSGEGSPELKLGRAIVTVPTAKDREQGAIPRPDWDLLFWTVAIRDEDRARDFTLQTIDVLSEEAFGRVVKQRMRDAKSYKDQAFVFVHGYRVGFDDAIFRTAQISYDIGFDSAAFVFSWPSSGSLWGYQHDSKRVLGARDNLRRFLALVQRETGAKKVHLIAHSMGSVLLTEVLRDLGASMPKVVEKPLFNEIILAAPDVTRDNFLKIAARMQPLASGVTLYASSKDKALQISGDLALGELPAGYVPDSGTPVIVKGVDTIDISDISTDFFNLNHSEFADRKQLLEDMGLLLQTGTHPPKVRFNVFEELRVPDGVYWKYRK